MATLHYALVDSVDSEDDSEPASSGSRRRVLLLGATGFVGEHVLQILIARRHFEVNE